MIFTERLIGPAEAASMLERNHSNRVMREGRVRAIADAIIRGEWQLTHQAVAIAPDGSVIDGQHRLAAIVRTGRTLPIHLALNVDPATFGVIDVGSPRSPRDIARAGGYDPDTAAAGRIAIAYRASPPTASWSSNTSVFALTTAVQVLQYLETLDDPDSDVLRARRTARGLGRSGIRTSLGALLFLAQPGDKVDTFMEALRTGENLPAGHPALAYRSFVNSQSSRRLNRQEHFARILAAWNAHHEGRPLKLIKWVGPAMPELRGAKEAR